MHSVQRVKAEAQLPWLLGISLQMQKYCCLYANTVLF